MDVYSSKRFRGSNVRTYADEFVALGVRTPQFISRPNNILSYDC